jgi:hypothetical protein
MMQREKLRQYGLQKLAEQMYRYGPEVSEPKSDGTYLRSALIGALSGSGIGAIGSKLLKKNMGASAGIGAATGLLAGLTREYDQRSDPVGLSPIYTIPAGASLGGLTGAVSGAGLGKYTRYGVIPGALLGAAAGAAGGTAVSDWI